MLLFLTGLFFFLAGLEGSKKSLTKLALKRVELLLKKLSDNNLLSLLVGVVSTAILQSSSGLTVIVISLIESGYLALKPAVLIIMGANIGTTLTVHLISLPIISYYSCIIISGLVVAIIGLFVNKKVFFGGLSLFCFGTAFAGLHLMTASFDLASSRNIIYNLLAFSRGNYLKGILLGALATGIVQSSSVITAITVSLARVNLINLSDAIAVTLGSNIGTCITGFLASINASIFSKRLAWGHLLFNFIGVLVLLPVIKPFIFLLDSTNTSLARQVANAHTLFNIYNLIIFLPFLNTFISVLRRGLNGDI
ncbi:Na-cotransporter [Halothermothrix orenii H 168]|uniref:Na-cotransporter n=2 Tax=Halothermothrix orenii TaxID=31909 RepID=B8CWG1_HALOH|nr:Na-cotransporter [Halothermothrix orenii H 168]